MEKNLAAVALGALGSAKGGRIRAERLSPERRFEIAQQGGRARWTNHDGLDHLRSIGTDQVFINHKRPNETNTDGRVCARHPLIVGLLRELPVEGSEWPTDDRVKWLQAAALIMDLVYKRGDGDSGKSVTIEAVPSAAP